MDVLFVTKEAVDNPGTAKTPVLSTATSVDSPLPHSLFTLGLPCVCLVTNQTSRKTEWDDLCCHFVVENKDSWAAVFKICFVLGEDAGLAAYLSTEQLQHW